MVLDDLIGGIVEEAVKEAAASSSEAVLKRRYRSQLHKLRTEGRGMTKARIRNPERRFARNLRGAVVRNGSEVVWRSFLRRWRRVAIDDSIGSIVEVGKTPVRRARRFDITVKVRDQNEWRTLRVTPDRKDLVLTLLRPLETTPDAETPASPIS